MSQRQLHRFLGSHPPRHEFVQQTLEVAIEVNAMFHPTVHASPTDPRDF